MRILKGLLNDLYEALYKGGVWTTEELCEEVGFSSDFYCREKVRSLIGQLRKKYRQSEVEYDNPWLFANNGRHEILSWVGTSIAGYTLLKNSEIRAFECRMRAEQSTNIALNGAPAFVDFKRLAPKAFFNLQIAVKPKLLKMNRLIK